MIQQRFFGGAPAFLLSLSVVCSQGVPVEVGRARMSAEGISSEPNQAWSVDIVLLELNRERSDQLLKGGRDLLKDKAGVAVLVKDLQSLLDHLDENPTMGRVLKSKRFEVREGDCTCVASVSGENVTRSAYVRVNQTKVMLGILAESLEDEHSLEQRYTQKVLDFSEYQGRPFLAVVVTPLISRDGMVTMALVRHRGNNTELPELFRSFSLTPPSKKKSDE